MRVGLWAFLKARFSRGADAAVAAIMRETLAAHEGAIKQHGLSVQYVATDDPNDVPYGYSVGLCAYGLPELLVTGVPQDAAEQIIKRVATELMLTKNVEPRIIENVIENHSAALRWIFADEFFAMAIFAEIWSTVNGIERRGGMQILLPEPNGSFGTS